MPRGRVVRRDANWWAPLNTAYRQFMKANGAKPDRAWLESWFEQHAAVTWPNGDQPSVQHAWDHCKCLRTLDQARDYFRQYRARKKDEREAHREDGTPAGSASSQPPRMPTSHDGSAVEVRVPSQAPERRVSVSGRRRCRSTNGSTLDEEPSPQVPAKETPEGKPVRPQQTASRRAQRSGSCTTATEEEPAARGSDDSSSQSFSISGRRGPRGGGAASGSAAAASAPGAEPAPAAHSSLEGAGLLGDPLGLGAMGVFGAGSGGSDPQSMMAAALVQQQLQQQQQMMMMMQLQKLGAQNAPGAADTAAMAQLLQAQLLHAADPLGVLRLSAAAGPGQFLGGLHNLDLLGLHALGDPTIAPTPRSDRIQVMTLPSMDDDNAAHLDLASAEPNLMLQHMIVAAAKQQADRQQAALGLDADGEPQDLKVDARPATPRTQTQDVTVKAERRRSYPGVDQGVTKRRVSGTNSVSTAATNRTKRTSFCSLHDLAAAAEALEAA